MAQRLVKEIEKEIRSGSFRGMSDRARREELLLTVAREMTSRPNDGGLNYRGLSLKNMQARHVEKYVKHGQARGLSDRTIENRMSALRWLAKKTGRPEMVPTNKALGLRGAEGRIPSSSRASQPITAAGLSDRVQMCADLSRQFGFRPMESALIQPEKAIKVAGERIQIKLENGKGANGPRCTWCKGGRARSFAVKSTPQRLELLDRWKELTKSTSKGSLINTEKSRTFRDRMYKELRAAGIEGLHGQRHSYAQSIYQQLTGLAAPHAGGPGFAGMSAEQKESAQAAIDEVARHLGHGEGRDDVTQTYLGKF